ncbi:hypothetical protein SAMN05444274_102427 [Mariniphaga anaerophila]|uniref:Uncharacterized protein n=1 Tax=Mariniphaga anaerophila TaxID=1484053 RepID=A0A1M4WF01_9BACT|nr:hypothetical protein SAMN05444274_102427 [Mariniphaga anaerophila]
MENDFIDLKMLFQNKDFRLICTDIHFKNLVKDR